ncbi:MAG TPA: MBL fold metallo-hydrolase [Ktedonobacteraceae bacterium]|nr:MBL fold metallo-hydrolase [Ktedonobacteraceae bacterium]
MKLRNWMKLGALSLGTLGIGLAVKSFLPQRFATAKWPVIQERTVRPDIASLPAVGIEFLRCGSATIPECIAVRGAMSFVPRVITHSAVLIRHPRATFLYDTGLCADVYTYLVSRPLLFRKTLANFTLEQSLHDHFQRLNVARGELDFALLSHLHWDHVSGIPDIPGVPLRINRVEYDAARYGLFAANNDLVSQLMCDNPIELFDCAGPAYEGFRSSYDLFGDGSVVLVPLPGHTAGNTGMFINRSNGSRVFLLGDAAWVSENYLRPATMHPFIWSSVTSDDATARETLIQLHRYAKRHPNIPLIAMHDAALQDAFMAVECHEHHLHTSRQ